MVNAVFLLVAIAIGGNAAAAVTHGCKPAHHNDCAHGAAKTVARASDGSELTPLTPVTSPKPFAAPSVRPAPRAARIAAAPVALPLYSSPVAASPSDARHALADLLHGDAGSSPDVMPMLSAPLAWAILLAGLVGLFAIARGPAVARVQSWATPTPSRSSFRPTSRASALDRVDPARYAQAQVARSHGGHFVRTTRTFAAA